MRRSLAKFSESEASNHTPSLADFTTTTPELKFSVHTGQREVSFDLADFYHNESRLYGVDTLKRDLTSSAEVLEVLMPRLVAEDYRTAPILQICGLGQAQEAYRAVAAGSTGRVVLRPQE